MTQIPLDHVPRVSPAEALLQDGGLLTARTVSGDSFQELLRQAQTPPPAETAPPRDAPAAGWYDGQSRPKSPAPAPEEDQQPPPSSETVDENEEKRSPQEESVTAAPAEPASQQAAPAEASPAQSAAAADPSRPPAARDGESNRGAAEGAVQNEKQRSDEEIAAKRTHVASEKSKAEAILTSTARPAAAKGRGPKAAPVAANVATVVEQAAKLTPTEAKGQATTVAQNGEAPAMARAAAANQTATSLQGQAAGKAAAEVTGGRVEKRPAASERRRRAPAEPASPAASKPSEHVVEKKSASAAINNSTTAGPQDAGVSSTDSATKVETRQAITGAVLAAVDSAPQAAPDLAKPAVSENEPIRSGPAPAEGAGSALRSSTSAPAPKATEHGQVDAARFVQRVAQAFQAAGERGGTLRLRLSPPELGSLRIEISVRNGAMHARLQTDKESTRNLLLDNLPALRDRLAQQDIRIERFHVDLADQSGGGLTDRSANQAQTNQQGRGDGGAWAPLDSSSDRQGSGSPAPRRLGEGSQLDVVV